MSDHKPRSITNAVLNEVLKERTAQDTKWGEQNHDPFLYLTILMEEVGEAAKDALQTKFGGSDLTKLRKELVQCAAVAVAAVECLDRDTWDWGNHWGGTRK